MSNPEGGPLRCRAISIFQPNASLIALGLQRIHTRNYATAYRGLVAIQARWFPAHWDRPAQDEPVRSLLASHDLVEDQLPTHQILGVCELVGCVLISELAARRSTISRRTERSGCRGVMSWTPQSDRSRTTRRGALPGC